MIKRFPFRQWDCLPLMVCYLDSLHVPDVSLVAKFLLDYCKERGWPCDIGIAAIAKALKITQRRVENAIEDMREFGIADVDGYTDTLTFNWRGLRRQNLTVWVIASCRLIEEGRFIVYWVSFLMHWQNYSTELTHANQ